jgi:large subunit ribosomal protein L31
MKKEIHPKYEKSTIQCACGNALETKSTGAEIIKVDLCSACHPFYTGKQKFIDAAGRVDKFRARMEAASKKEQSKAEKEAKTETPKDNKETLKEIKSQISDTRPPIAVTQETTSDSEGVAADELKASKESKTKEK